MVHSGPPTTATPSSVFLTRYPLPPLRSKLGRERRVLIADTHRSIRMPARPLVDRAPATILSSPRRHQRSKALLGNVPIRRRDATEPKWCVRLPSSTAPRQAASTGSSHPPRSASARSSRSAYLAAARRAVAQRFVSCRAPSMRLRFSGAAHRSAPWHQDRKACSYFDFGVARQAAPPLGG
jgi:hypothetical protein